MQIEVKVWLYDVLNAIVEIESYFERVELIAKQTKSLSIDFNPTIGEGGQKIYHTKLAYQK